MGKCATILVFHAAPLVRKVVCEYLEAEGHVVRATGDLGVAVDMLRETPPDLLVVGIYVANIEGHDAALYLSKKCPGMQVLMLSGLPADQRIQTWIELAGFFVFPPPFERADLIAKVTAVLAHPKASHA